MSLLKRLKKSSSIKESVILSESKYYDPNWAQPIPTEIPMLNVALSGHPEGGLTSGILMICGDSKHFKTGFMLETAKGFMNKYPEDGVILFYDSEFGAPISYFKSRGIDMGKVLHCPIRTVEELRIDLAKQLVTLTEDDNVFIMIDSIGNLASKKEAEDAEDGKTTVDMTRAKALNSLFRIVTPHLTMKNIPFVVINHTYDTMDGKGAKVVSGGKKVYLSADDVWIIGRQQDKDAEGLHGFRFVVNIDKSRACVERSKVLIHSTFKDGIDKYSGLYDEAKECGLLIPAGAWVKQVNFETGEVSENKRRADIEEDVDFFEKLLKHPPFIKHLANKFKLINED